MRLAATTEITPLLHLGGPVVMELIDNSWTCISLYCIVLYLDLKSANKGHLEIMLAYKAAILVSWERNPRGLVQGSGP